MGNAEPPPNHAARLSSSARNGVGLGLRWDFLEEVVEGPALPIDFFEVSPENYMRRGGYYPAQLERIRDRYPLVTHGLTLSIGGAAEPDDEYLRELRTEIERVGTPFHSDHLCFSSAGALMLHDLLPLKLTRANAARVAERGRRVADKLGVPLALENISYYLSPGRPELSEVEFIERALSAGQLGLLLDVNNVYVNAQNHGFSPLDFLGALDLGRVVEIHVAGHSRKSSGLVLDTHGAKVANPVLELLAFVVERIGPVPVLLERDNDVPGLAELVSEVEAIRIVYERSVERFRRSHARSA